METLDRSPRGIGTASLAGILSLSMDTLRHSSQPVITARQPFLSRRTRLPGRFSVLLAAMLLLFIVQPFFEGHWLALTLLNIFVSGIMVSGIYAVSQKKRDLLIASLLGMPALVGRWLLLITPHQAIFFIESAFALSFFIFTAATILAQVARAKRVTTDTISAALCSYVLIGMVWAVLYTFLEFLHPGSFSPPLREQSFAGGNLLPKPQFPRFVYFSFMTLTSTGFGDITPLTEPTRSFAILESIIGQFYIAVLISRLVGLYIVHSLAERDSS